jgi:hypothetical protein
MSPEESKLSVFDANGVQVDKGDSVVDLSDPDRLHISVSLDTSKMADGIYTVKWETVSLDDGDAASGEFHFTVGHEAGDADHQMEGAEGESQDDHSIATGMVDGQEVTLKVVAPAAGALVPAGDVTMEGSVEGITLGENGVHLHFYVDDALAAMGSGTQTQHVVNLEPGSHDLAIRLATSEHADALNAHVHVKVEGATAPADSTTNTASAPAQATLPGTGGSPPNTIATMLALAGALLLGAGAFVSARASK